MNYNTLVNRLHEMGREAFLAETEALRAQMEAAYERMLAATDPGSRLDLMQEAGQLEEVVNVRFELLDPMA